MAWFGRIAFNWMHPHTIWPRRTPSGLEYVCCLDCGRELPYSVERMSLISSAGDQEHSSLKYSAVAAALILLMCLVLLASRAAAQTSEAAVRHAVRSTHLANDGPPTFVIGFVGGFVHNDDVRHSEVQLARRLQQSYGERIKVEIYENRQQAQAHKAIVQWLNRAGKQPVTNEIPQQPHIILFGHSWGASAVIYLARRLELDHVPVALTVQVDSVRKHGEDDSVVPTNVLEAINFYQTRGIVHGRAAIAAADPSRTTILGNVRFDYRKEPSQCRIYPWYDRLFFKGHTAIECDPQVWSQVESCIEARLPHSSEVSPSNLAAGLGN